MNMIRNTLLAGLAVMTIGGAGFAAAQATPATPAAPAATAAQDQAGHAAGHEQRHKKMAERFAKRQASLHDALKLTPSQETAWAAYQQATKPAAKGQHGERAAWKALSAPARMEKMIAMSKQHTSMMESRLAALNTFYAVLTPEQKKVFDEQSQGRKHGGHHKNGMKQHG
jgi:Spy/CpxP family protein refolding chaperone